VQKYAIFLIRQGIRKKNIFFFFLTILNTLRLSCGGQRYNLFPSSANLFLGFYQPSKKYKKLKNVALLAGAKVTYKSAFPNGFLGFF